MTAGRTAHVIVLGSLVQSPRIVLHARYLALSGWSVSLSGYLNKGEDFPESNGLRIFPIVIGPDFRKFIYPHILALIFKFVFVSVLLLCHLIRHCRSNVVLLQNPPAVPSFMLLWIYTRMTRKHLMIDWHNYGYSLLELNSKRNSLSSRIYRFLELGFAERFLTDCRHFCVSRALQQDLRKHKIQAVVYYDRPPEEFKSTSVDLAHQLFTRLSLDYHALGDRDGSLRRTRFTEITVLPASHGGLQPQWRRDRPALVVSSCSWTPDDDFSIVLDALDIYNAKADTPRSTLPNMMFVVTGRGPLKAHYERLIRNKRWARVEVIMPWLDWADYPVFLGCADLGVSLHRSSSGLDLPMKVVDLIGVGVPVLALTYPTLHELLPNNGSRLGCHFTDADDLARLMVQLLTPSQPTDIDEGLMEFGSSELRRLRLNLQNYNKHTTRAFAYWQKVALPAFNKALTV
ncbi:beta-1,4-mannosyltransferase [Paragonimus westermani]|uniref:Beta-1,4-mannosyltransferase n=1 Tax=Paragonimus westermani TaxID=34504 RepID=A0A5J4NNY6_9TREM|nr:beta-1,4-mannosyltransferase [Paragonimus westermani]